MAPMAYTDMQGIIPAGAARIPEGKDELGSAGDLSLNRALFFLYPEGSSE